MRCGRVDGWAERGGRASPPWEVGGRVQNGGHRPDLSGRRAACRGHTEGRARRATVEASRACRLPPSRTSPGWRGWPGCRHVRIGATAMRFNRGGRGRARCQDTTVTSGGRSNRRRTGRSRPRQAADGAGVGYPVKRLALEAHRSWSPVRLPVVCRLESDAAHPRRLDRRSTRPVPVLSTSRPGRRGQEPAARATPLIRCPTDVPAQRSQVSPLAGARGLPDPLPSAHQR